MTVPRIGITLGDPAGIGPEIIIKAFSEATFPEAEFYLYGNSGIIKEEIQALGMDPQTFSRKSTGGSDQLKISIHEIEGSPPHPQKGIASPENGRFSFQAFEEAVKDAQDKKLQAIVTAPISKHSWQQGGIRWAGHTDFLVSRYPKAIMSFWSERLIVALFSHHISLKEAVQRIDTNSLFSFFCDLHQAVLSLRKKSFNLLVAGLNPHAGESGLFGTEEEQVIAPAIEKAQKNGINIIGPIPPDVIFRKALSQPNTIVIALYHDQGLIPFKLEAFKEGVNATLGLPFIRTSPDHGTAFDIAGKGTADPASMIGAIQLAFDLI